MHTDTLPELGAVNATNEVPDGTFTLLVIVEVSAELGVPAAVLCHIITITESHAGEGLFQAVGAKAKVLLELRHKVGHRAPCVGVHEPFCGVTD
jgi:hypothetical protein